MAFSLCLKRKKEKKPVDTFLFQDYSRVICTGSSLFTSPPPGPLPHTHTLCTAAWILHIPPHQAWGCFLSWLERTGWEGGACSRWARGVLGSRCLPSLDSVSPASQLRLLGRLRDQRQVRTQSPAWHGARGHFCDWWPASSWKTRVGPQSPGVLHLQALGRVTLSCVVTVLARHRGHRGRPFPGAAEAVGLQRE